MLTLMTYGIVMWRQHSQVISANQWTVKLAIFEQRTTSLMSIFYLNRLEFRLAPLQCFCPAVFFSPFPDSRCRTDTLWHRETPPCWRPVIILWRRSMATCYTCLCRKVNTKLIVWLSEIGLSILCLAFCMDSVRRPSRLVRLIWYSIQRSAWLLSAWQRSRTRVETAEAYSDVTSPSIKLLRNCNEAQ